MMFEIGALLCVACVCAWVVGYVVAGVATKKIRAEGDFQYKRILLLAEIKKGETANAVGEMEARAVEALQRVQQKAEGIERDLDAWHWPKSDSMHKN